MKIIVKILLGFVILIAGAITLLALRSNIDPVAWSPAPNPGLTGNFAPNEKLATIQLLLSGQVEAPEDVAQDASGRFYTGTLDGSIVRFNDQGESEVFVNTGGRPLGMQFDAEGNLIVADALLGLLSVSPNGIVRVLTDSVDGEKMIFVDDLDIAADGTIWFSDASQRFDYQTYVYDIIEASSTGRLLSYSPLNGATSVHLQNLYFANGVALGPDDKYVLVTETPAGRITRLWLKGEKTGSSDLFYNGLPGAPDNLSFNGRDTFWVALPAVRDPGLEGLAGKPFIRKLIGALPTTMLMPKESYSIIIGLDLEGNLTHNFQMSDSVFHSLTSVNQFGDKLYIGSIASSSVGVFDLSGQGN